MRRLMLASLLAAVALAPVAAQAQRMERRAADGERERGDRPRLTPEQREQRRAERAARRAECAESGAERDRRLDGDGERLARPDGVFPRQEGQMFPSARDRRREARRDRREERREDRRARRDDRRDELRYARRGWAYGGWDDHDEWLDGVHDRRDWASRSSRAGWGRDAYRGGLVWNRGWRADRRYDWSRHREGNRGLYRLPRYYAPYGHGYDYRRFGLGATLSRSLLAPGYWIDDAWSYRLPPAYGPYRWVRYHGDALLIDLRTGRVIDVVHGIFW